MPAPIALFAFNRPGHLERTLAALAANRSAGATEVIAFADGPRHAGDVPGVAAVREVLARWAGRNAFARFTPIAHERNRGLAASLSAGIATVLADREQVVVLEDDIVTAEHFLDFCNDGLAVYAADPRVASIHGYVYPVDSPLPQTFFLRGGDCWGWATWRRAWAHYRPDGRALLRELRRKGSLRDFDMGGACGFSRMLRHQVLGQVDSWAIRWRASAWLAGMHTLYPGTSLVVNIGNDGSGTHSEASARYDQVIATEPVPVTAQEVREDPRAAAAVARYFRAAAIRPATFRARISAVAERLRDRWQPV